MKKIILLALVFILSACSFSSTNEIKANQDKWIKSGITHYRFELSIGCFCAFRDKMPLLIEVKDGEVVSMTYGDGSPVPADDANLEFFNGFSTVDRLFQYLQSDAAKKADEVKVDYEPTYGYPIMVSIDQIKAAMDDEYGITISNFEILN